MTSGAEEARTEEGRREETRVGGKRKDKVTTPTFHNHVHKHVCSNQEGGKQNTLRLQFQC